MTSTKATTSASCWYAHPSLHIVAFFLFCLLIGFGILARTERYFGNLYRGWDSQFYYSAALSIAYDLDLDITNDIERTTYPKPFLDESGGAFTQLPRRSDGRVLNKYPIGTSLVEVPMVLVGKWFVPESEKIKFPTGFSPTELRIVAWGLFIFTSIGLTVLYKNLSKDFGVSGALIGVIGCWSGTSLFYYSAIFPFMSHAIAFVLLVVCMSIFRGIVASVNVGSSVNIALFTLGLALSALFLVRPQQIVLVVFLLPQFLYFASRVEIRRWWIGASLAICSIAMAITVQALINKDQFQQAGINAYSHGGEGFSWLNPALHAVLISESRGLFRFSPVFLIALMGLMFFAKSIPSYSWAFLANALFQTYLVAAWSSPLQGDAFGCRMLSDNSAIVAVGLASLYCNSSAFHRIAVVVSIFVCVAWTNYLLVIYIT